MGLCTTLYEQTCATEYYGSNMKALKKHLAQMLCIIFWYAIPKNRCIYLLNYGTQPYCMLKTIYYYDDHFHSFVGQFFPKSSFSLKPQTL